MCLPFRQVTTQSAAYDDRAAVRFASPLVLSSVLASTFGIVFAQFLDDLGDGLLAQILGADAVLFNNRAEFSGVDDVALAGGFVLCLVVGLFALFVYPTQSGHGLPRLVLLWTLLHVLRQALVQAALLPIDSDSQLAQAYDSLDMPAGLDVIVAAAGGIGLLLIALASAAAFLAFAPHRRQISTSRKRFIFVLWLALIPAVVSVFAAIPFFLPDSEGLVLPGLPFAALIFVATLLAAPGTTTVTGPEDPVEWSWPIGLGVFLVVVLFFSLAVLAGGVSIDPRQWGSAL